MAANHTINITLRANGAKQVDGELTSVEKSLGRLPGAFGKIQSAASGAFSKALAVVGAFKVGSDIGEWIYNKVLTPLLKLKDPIEELKKQNRELQREADAAGKRWEETLSKWSKSWEKQVTGIDKTRQKINDLTEAYLKMQAARERIQAAGDDATLLGLERNRFDAMAGASSPEEAALIGRRHDILIAETRAKQQIAQFDREAAVASTKQASAEEQLAQAREKRAKLTRQMFELEEKFQKYIESQEAADRMGFERSNAEEAKLLKQKEALNKELEAVQREVRNRENDVAAMRESRTAEAQERANLVARTKLEIDERKKALEDYSALAEQKRIEEERKAAAERERLDQEAHQRRIAELRAEIAAREEAMNPLRARAAAAQSEFDQAFALFRSPASAAAQRAEEEAYRNDLNRLHKTASRYGGKWRIDELSALMAAGDTQGVSDTLAGWRRSRSFTPEVEAMVRASAAERTKTTTEDELRKIEANTANLANKLDELLAVKGGANG